MRGTLADSGPLYALIDRGDSNHESAVNALDDVELHLLTTWPCLAEVMHFLRKTLGWSGQSALAEMIRRNDLVVLDSSNHPISPVLELMETYSDAPMDLADGSLVAAARALGKLQIFTFDSHFHAYRPTPRRRFRLIPCER